MKEIVKVFNAKDQEELKDGFKKIILRQFEYDLEKNEYYLFDPSCISELIDEAFGEVVKDIMKQIKSDVKAKILSGLEELKPSDIKKMLL